MSPGQMSIFHLTSGKKHGEKNEDEQANYISISWEKRKEKKKKKEHKQKNGN